MSSDSIEKLFEDGLSSLSFTLSNEILEKLISYQSCLSKWNKTINLTAHRSLANSIEKNFLDSLSMSSFIRGDRVLDFGSGAGFPGLVLAIYYPRKTFFLIEADLKKSSFLKYVVSTLDLKNVSIISKYVEMKSVAEVFPPHLDSIVSRATISPDLLINFADLSLKSNHHLLLMLSQKQILNFELNSNSKFEIEEKQKYLLPWSKVVHYLLILRKK